MIKPPTFQLKGRHGRRKRIRIIIDYDPNTGECGLVGPLENPTMFLGLLETAKMIMMEQRAKAQRTSIIPGATPFDPRLLKPH